MNSKDWGFSQGPFAKPNMIRLSQFQEDPESQEEEISVPEILYPSKVTEREPASIGQEWEKAFLTFPGEEAQLPPTSLHSTLREAPLPEEAFVTEEKKDSRGRTWKKAFFTFPSAYSLLREVVTKTPSGAKVYDISPKFREDTEDFVLDEDASQITLIPPGSNAPQTYTFAELPPVDREYLERMIEQTTTSFFSKYREGFDQLERTAREWGPERGSVYHLLASNFTTNAGRVLTGQASLLDETGNPVQEIRGGLIGRVQEAMDSARSQISGDMELAVRLGAEQLANKEWGRDAEGNFVPLSQEAKDAAVEILFNQLRSYTTLMEYSPHWDVLSPEQKLAFIQQYVMLYHNDPVIMWLNPLQIPCPRPLRNFVESLVQNVTRSRRAIEQLNLGEVASRDPVEAFERYRTHLREKEISERAPATSMLWTFDQDVSLLKATPEDIKEIVKLKKLYTATPRYPGYTSIVTTRRIVLPPEFGEVPALDIPKPEGIQGFTIPRHTGQVAALKHGAAREMEILGNVLNTLNELKDVISLAGDKPTFQDFAENPNNAVVVAQTNQLMQDLASASSQFLPTYRATIAKAHPRAEDPELQRLMRLSFRIMGSRLPLYYMLARFMRAWETFLEKLAMPERHGQAVHIHPAVLESAKQNFQQWRQFVEQQTESEGEEGQELEASFEAEKTLIRLAQIFDYVGKPTIADMVEFYLTA